MSPDDPYYSYRDLSVDAEPSPFVQCLLVKDNIITSAYIEKVYAKKGVFVALRTQKTSKGEWQWTKGWRVLTMAKSTVHDSFIRYKNCAYQTLLPISPYPYASEYNIITHNTPV